MNDKDSNERRRYFRIEDEICLDYEVISDEEYSKAPEVLAQMMQSAFSLSASFAALNNEYNPLLNSIKHASPEIGQYLELLNRKIDSLGQQLLEEETPCDEGNAIEANLSASGIAFQCSEQLKDGQGMKLKIVLLPEKIGVILFGRVQHCLQSAEQKKDDIICIDFEHIRYDDQELIIKHNLNKQMQELRQRSEDEDSI
jgi:hypothetical protein